MDAMKNADLSYGELAKLTGIPKSALQRYATGETVKIPLDRIEAIAKATNVKASQLLGWNREPISGMDDWVIEHYPDFKPGTNYLSDCEFIPSHPDILPVTTRRIPLLGTIACGEPIMAESDLDTFAVVGSAIECDFALRCKGDSMIGARIFDGDLVFIRKQDYVDDGAIAAVLLDDDATLKRVYHLADGRVELRAENPTFKSIIIGGDNETRTCRILGKAVAFQSIVI